MGVSGWEGETFTMNTMNIVDPDEGGAGKDPEYRANSSTVPSTLCQQHRWTCLCLPMMSETNLQCSVVFDDSNWFGI